MQPSQPMNVQRRATSIAGWIGLFRGESLGSAVERTIMELNADGYRVVFMVPDRWSVARVLLNILITVVTLGNADHRRTPRRRCALARVAPHSVYTLGMKSRRGTPMEDKKPERVTDLRIPTTPEKLAQAILKSRKPPKP